MKRCRNLEIKVRLGDEINKINGKLTCIWKIIKESFNDYCSYRGQIIELKGKYYDLYAFHCKYYKEVQILIILFIYFIFIYYIFIFLLAS